MLALFETVPSGPSADRMVTRPTPDLPAPTSEGRREQLSRELACVAEGRPSLPPTPVGGLRRAEKRRAQWLALVRLARLHPDEYRTLLCEEMTTARTAR